MILEVQGITVQVIRKPVKHINLRIKTTGEVSVSAPASVSTLTIQGFLHGKSDWITAHRQRLQNYPPPRQSHYTSGERHPYLGKHYPLMICDHAPYQKITLEGDVLYCFFKGESSVAQRQLALNAWYRQQMLALVPELMQRWERQINVNVSRWGIRLMKRRWGSCQPLKKHVLLNLTLIQKPLAAIEFVIVHELIHLLEASHNKRFYQFMDLYLPNWRESKQLLTIKTDW